MTPERAATNRPSPWRTPFAHRTYAAGVPWASGVADMPISVGAVLLAWALWREGGARTASE